MKKNRFSMVNEDGQEIFYDVLFTFESEETNKNYIVYTDNSKDETGNIRVFASIYYPDEADSRLDPITTEKEWRVIETILGTLQEEIEKKNSENEE